MVCAFDIGSGKSLGAVAGGSWVVNALPSHDSLFVKFSAAASC